MSTARLHRPLAIASLVYAAALWGLVWYPYRLLAEAGVGGIASSFFSYAIPLLLVGWLHGRAVVAARSRWAWLVAMGLAAGWTNLAYVLAVLEGEVVRVLLLFYLSPLWTVLFAGLLLRERLNRAGWAVMALAAGGEVGVPGCVKKVDLGSLVFNRDHRGVNGNSAPHLFFIKV